MRIYREAKIHGRFLPGALSGGRPATDQRALRPGGKKQEILSEQKPRIPKDPGFSFPPEVIDDGGATNFHGPFLEGPAEVRADVGAVEGRHGVVSQFSVLHDQGCNRGLRMLIKKRVVTHAESEHDVELRPLFGEYPRLLRGVAGDLAYPGPFGHPEGGFLDTADLAADGMDVELLRKYLRQDPRLFYETQAEGYPQGFVTHPPRELHRFVDPAGLPVKERLHVGRGFEDLPVDGVIVKGNTVGPPAGVSFVAGVVFAEVALHEGSSRRPARRTRGPRLRRISGLTRTYPTILRPLVIIPRRGALSLFHKIEMDEITNRHPHHCK